MFAPGPRAVGFTIVWPEGVIFRSMMTYHVQFLLLVLAGWVNRQQQDVIDYLQEENRVLRAGLRGKRLSLSEPPRVSRRLQLLRGWSHDKTKQVFTGGKRARSADGFRPAGSARISVVSDLIDCVED